LLNCSPQTNLLKLQMSGAINKHAFYMAFCATSCKILINYKRKSPAQNKTNFYLTSLK